MTHYNQSYMDSHQVSVISGQSPVEWHHAIYKRNKNIPELNAKENLLPLTHDEHLWFEAHGYEARCRAWLMKCQEFGLEHMTRWHDELPMKTKERF